MKAGENAIVASESPPVANFKSFYFDTGLGYIFYYFLRNDWIWSRLSEQERAFVKIQNQYWNNNNPGYKDPDQYQGQGGKSFLSTDDRDGSWEGQQLKLFLSRERPRSVLEIGPGSGYYTRQIIECESVEKYIASDINVKFLDYIEGAISRHERGSRIQKEFVAIDKLDSTGVKVDAIILLSALHHIPDRYEFIDFLAGFLGKGGVIFFYEPTHYLPRVMQLGLSFILNKWYSTKVISRRNNYMTHHFCTLAEMNDISRAVGLITDFWTVQGWLPSIFGGLSALFSKKMVAVLRRKS